MIAFPSLTENRIRLTGLQFFIELYLLVNYFHFQPPGSHPTQVATDFHHPCNSQVHHEAAKNGARMVGNHTQDQATKKRTDAFTQGLAEMDGAIKYRHRQDGFFTIPPGKSQHQETTKE